MARVLGLLLLIWEPQSDFWVVGLRITQPELLWMLVGEWVHAKCVLWFCFFFSFLLLRFIYLKGRATSLKHWFTFQCLQPVLDWAEARSQPFLSESSMWVAEPKYLVHYPLSARHLSKKLEWKSCSWPELVLHSGYRLSHHSLSHRATCLPPICVCHSLLFRDNK